MTDLAFHTINVLASLAKYFAELKRLQVPMNRPMVERLSEILESLLPILDKYRKQNVVESAARNCSVFDNTDVKADFCFAFNVLGTKMNPEDVINKMKIAYAIQCASEHKDDNTSVADAEHRDVEHTDTSVTDAADEHKDVEHKDTGAADAVDEHKDVEHKDTSAADEHEDTNAADEHKDCDCEHCAIHNSDYDTTSFLLENLDDLRYNLEAGLEDGMHGVDIELLHMLVSSYLSQIKMMDVLPNVRSLEDILNVLASPSKYYVPAGTQLHSHWTDRANLSDDIGFIDDRMRRVLSLIDQGKFNSACNILHMLHVFWAMAIRSWSLETVEAVSKRYNSDLREYEKLQSVLDAYEESPICRFLRQIQSIRPVLPSSQE